MNDRIKSLLDQAKKHVEHGEGCYPATTIRYDALEKFAELIVRECVDICNQAVLQNQDTLSKLGDDELAEKMITHGAITQAQKLGEGIKEHFGVEL